MFMKSPRSAKLKFTKTYKHITPLWGQFWGYIYSSFSKAGKLLTQTNFLSILNRSLKKYGVYHVKGQLIKKLHTMTLTLGSRSWKGHQKVSPVLKLNCGKYHASITNIVFWGGDKNIFCYYGPLQGHFGGTWPVCELKQERFKSLWMLQVKFTGGWWLMP